MVRSRRQEQQAVEPTEKTPIQQYGELWDNPTNRHK